MQSAIENFRLVVFRNVAKRLSFTQAAEALRLTQPAVTSHIKALEDDLGIRLFDRGGGRVALTRAGELLFDYAKESQRLSLDVIRRIGLLRGQELGRLTVGASTTIAQYVLPRLLVDYAAVHPGAEVSVVSGNTQDVVAQLLTRQTEIGFIEGPPGTSDLHTENFLEDEIVVIVAAGHVWSKKRLAPSLKDLAAQPLILREPGSGTRRVVEDALRRSGLGLRDLNIVLELDSTEGIKTVVEAGMGVGFVSRWALRSGHSGIRAVEVEGLRIGRTLQFVYPHGPEPEGPAGALLKLAREYRDRQRMTSRSLP